MLKKTGAIAVILMTITMGIPAYAQPDIVSGPQHLTAESTLVAFTTAPVVAAEMMASLNAYPAVSDAYDTAPQKRAVQRRAKNNLSIIREALPVLQS